MIHVIDRWRDRAAQPAILLLNCIVLSCIAACSGGGGGSNASSGLVINTSLTPAHGLIVQGTQNGPFAPSSMDYVLTNNAAEDLDYLLEATEPWVLLSGAVSGTARAQESLIFTVSLDAALVAALGPGNYLARVTVRETGSGTAFQNREVRLTVEFGPDSTLSPADGLVSSGPLNGPFNPSSKGYTLTNIAAVDLDYQLAVTEPWISLSGPLSGTLPAQASLGFTVSLDPAATAVLASGSYTAAVTVREAGSGDVLQQRGVELSIRGGGLGSPTLHFSTYFGGSDWDSIRDVAVDAAGNIYVVGGSKSNDFPTTSGAYDQTFNTGGNQIGPAGQSDGFVAKFTQDGQLVWSTYLGGINYERLYAVEVHTDGSVYVAGRVGPGFPVTPGAFQTEFKGSDSGFYGMQNGGVAKLAADGSGVIWSSYVGVGELVRDLDIDQNGDVYLRIGTTSRSNTQTPPSWFASAFDNAYQKTPANSRDTGVMKVSADGSQVLWATWFGGNGIDSEEGSVVVDDAGRPYIFFNTQSTNLPTTAGVPGTSLSGSDDVFLARFSADGSALELGTYLGSSGIDAVETHGLGVTNDAVIVGYASETKGNSPTFPGAFQPTHGGGWDGVVVKLALDGTQLAATYVGGSGDEEVDGLSVTPSGDVLLVGETTSLDFPVTQGALQSSFGGNRDAIVVHLAPDLSSAIYSTYMGGPDWDKLRAATFDGLNLIAAGVNNGPGWPTRNALQPGFTGVADALIAKFTRGSQTYGSGKAGSGGIVPQLAGSNDLALGSTYSLTVSRALGGFPGLVILGLDGSQASIPFLGGTLLVDPIALTFPFTLAGGQNVRGDDVFVLDIPIPMDVSVLGVNLNAQAAILDPGATFSLSLTNGVEARIF